MSSRDATHLAASQRIRSSSAPRLTASLDSSIWSLIKRSYDEDSSIKKPLTARSSHEALTSPHRRAFQPSLESPLNERKTLTKRPNDQTLMSTEMYQMLQAREQVEIADMIRHGLWPPMPQRQSSFEPQESAENEDFEGDQLDTCERGRDYERGGGSARSYSATPTPRSQNYEIYENENENRNFEFSTKKGKENIVKKMYEQRYPWDGLPDSFRPAPSSRVKTTFPEQPKDFLDRVKSRRGDHRPPFHAYGWKGSGPTLSARDKPYQSFNISAKDNSAIEARCGSAERRILTNRYEGHKKIANTPEQHADIQYGFGPKKNYVSASRSPPPSPSTTTTNSRLRRTSLSSQPQPQSPTTTNDRPSSSARGSVSGPLSPTSRSIVMEKRGSGAVERRSLEGPVFSQDQQRERNTPIETFETRNLVSSEGQQPIGDEIELARMAPQVDLSRLRESGFNAMMSAITSGQFSSRPTVEELEKSIERNPRYYKYLPKQFLEVIPPAGCRKREGSVKECLNLIA